MTASAFESGIFFHVARLPIEAAAAPAIWTRWRSLETWPEWDFSLLRVRADSDALKLGGRFSIVPRANGAELPVTVLSFCEGLHFTTGAAGPLGLMAFGHSLVPDAQGRRAFLEHSVCAVPSDPAAFGQHVWPRLVDGVDLAAGALVRLATPSGSEPAA